MYLTKNNRKFGLQFGFAAAASSAYNSFVVPYFNSMGFSSTQIGIIMTMYSLAIVIAFPIIGYLNDNYITVKKTMIFTAVASVIISVLFFEVPKTFVNMAIIMLLLSVFQKPTIGMIDTYVVKLSAKRSDLDYGFTRAMGSLGFAITAITLGSIIDYKGYNMMFAAQIILTTGVIVNTLRLEDVPIQKVKSIEEENKKVEKEKVDRFEKAKRLFGIKPYILAVLALTFSFGAMATCNTYASMLLEVAGGTPKSLGYLLFIMAFSEVPVMILYKRLEKIFGLERLLIFGMFMFVIKYYIVTVFVSVPVILASQLLQGISFGLVMPSITSLIYRLVPKDMSSTGLSIASTVYSNLSGVIGIMVGGRVIDIIGVVNLFRIMSGLCLVGAFIMVVNYNRYIKTES